MTLATNMYPGDCMNCGGPVKAEQGYRQRINGAWFVQHKDGECIVKDDDMTADFENIVAGLDIGITAPDGGDYLAINDSQSEPDASIYDHPVVKELQQQLAEVMKQIDEFDSKALKITEQLAQAKQAKADFLETIQEQIKAYDEPINELAKAKRELDQIMRANLDLKAKALADIDHALEAAKAQEMLAAAQERWQDIIAEHEWLWAEKAWEFQRVGIEFIASGIDRDLGGIALLDQMGLGKTLQARGAVDLLQAHPDFEQMLKDRMPGFDTDSQASSAVLWICPDAIKIPSQRELAKWSDAPVVVLDGNPKVRGHIVKMAHEMGMTLVVGYAQMRDRGGNPVTPELFDVNWPLVVMDEIHRAKNRETSTFWNMKKIVQKSAFCIPMTGTPVMNRADEFWTILHFITQKGKRMGEFEKFGNFERQYLSQYYGQGNAFAPGAFDHLIKSVADMVLRRRKDEVLKDLPDKVREVRFVEMIGKQRELYDMMRDKLYVWLDAQKSDSISATNFLAQLTRLRQIALLPSGVVIKGDPDQGTVDMTLDCDESAKVDDALELIQTLMEADEKVLIFSNYNGALFEIEKRIAAMELQWRDKDGNERPVLTGAIVGGVKNEDRASLQDRFNDPEDDVRVIVGNIAAMGVGLNMQGACSHAIFMDLAWSPGANEQAEDRLHRGGQTENVTIHIIQAEDSVDAFIAQKLEQKQGLIDGMIERDELRKALDDGLI